MKGSGLLNESDFKSLRFNVFEVDDKVDLNNRFRLDKLFKSFAEYANPDRNRLTRYIMYMYDVQSPFPHYYTDITKRKKEASALAGFDLEKDKERLDMLWMLSESNVLDMVLEFLRFQNNRIWTMIVSNEETFYEYSRTLLTKVIDVNNDKDRLSAVQTKSKIMDDLDNIDTRLKKYYRILYGENEVAEAVKRRGSSPEEIAVG